MCDKEELVKPFYYTGGETGLLLVHGFTACPVDMRPLGEYFSRLGYTVCAPLLKGHGTSPEQMKETSWQDWVDSASAGIVRLKEQCAKVIAIGHSMGGLISLFVASQGTVDGVISVNAPVIFQDRDLHSAEQLLGKLEYAEKPHKESEISYSKEGIPHFSYSKVPVACFVSLNRAIGEVRQELNKIECPALVIQSMEDATVHPQSAGIIADNIQHKQKDLIYWPGGEHNLPLSAERESLAQKIQDFLVKQDLAV